MNGSEWPASDRELVDLQHRLARAADAALADDPWSPPARVIGGCFVAFARGEQGPGHPGDHAWAAAVAVRIGPAMSDEDVVAQTIVAGQVPAAYTPGLLARREGPVLAAAVMALDVRPDVLLVDATGLDHPRRAGLALHLGAAIDLPTVGVTHRPLVASGAPPELRRGATAPVELDGRLVGFWVCTRNRTRPVIAHAGWRSTPQTAAHVVLAASTPAARTPVPLQQARRLARKTRAFA